MIAFARRHGGQRHRGSAAVAARQRLFSAAAASSLALYIPVFSELLRSRSIQSSINHTGRFAAFNELMIGQSDIHKHKLRSVGGCKADSGNAPTYLAIN
jgi:hypothetical protein